MARHRLLHAVLIVLAAVCVSAPTIGNGFVFDDHALVGGNAPVILGQESILSAFTYRYWGAADEASPNELYRPITIASIAANARLLGSGPPGMHAVNILLHAGNALLVWLLILKLFDRPGLALAAGLIFAVHPIATEAVAPLAGRADLLAALFMLSASIMGLAASRRRGAWILAGGLGVALVTFMGGLSKESFFAAPLVMTAVLGADRRRHQGTPRHYREYLMTAVTLVLIQLFVLSMVLVLRHRMLGYVYTDRMPSAPSTAYLAFVNNPLHTAEPLPRVLTALRVGVYAAGLMVLPLELSADYSYNEISIATGAGGPVEYAAVLFAALYLAVLFWSARRFPVVFFALSWSALTWLIVSNLLFPIGTIFGERLLYMPSIGFALLLAAGIARLGRLGGRWSAVAVALTVTLTGLFGARFVSRSADWSSDATLFHSAVKTSPNSAKAHSNYGWTLHVAGRYEEAIEQYGRALEIAPGLTGSGISLARSLSALGRHEEAIERYRAVLERDGGVSVAWSGLGLAQLAAGRPQEAEVSLRKALELSLGGNAEALRGLAEVMAASGRELKAGEILERLLTLSPAEPGLGEAFAEIQYRLGTRALEAGQRDEFLVRMRRAVEADASHGPAHYNLALAALESGDAAAARRHAEAGLKAGYAFPDGFLQACGIAPPAPAPGR